MPVHLPLLAHQKKISLFLSLFACRQDVYPKLWENPRDGRKGYSPVCRNEWSRLVCEKPRVNCSECPHQAFPPLDEAAARAHLTGKHIIGTYAIREDNTCIFLAADFDEGDWQSDILAYKNVAAELGIHVSLERSRSGNGGHAWIFFEVPVLAALARRLGTLILSGVAARNPFLSLKSYDRFFPNQDTIPPGGFGNLIALPLQEKPRKEGNSVFVNEQFIPYADQWQYLQNLTKCSAHKLDEIVGFVQQTSETRATTVPLSYEEKALDHMTSHIEKGSYTGIVHASIHAQIAIQIATLPRNLIAALKRLGTISPEQERISDL